MNTHFEPPPASNILIRAAARREIQQHAQYLKANAGPNVTDRFLDALQESFELLAHTLKAGTLCSFEKAALRRVRRWPVKDFENWLIFYRPRRNSVEIIHILHGARDIASLLDS